MAKTDKKKKAVIVPRLKYKQNGIVNFIEYKHAGFKGIYALMIIALFVILFISLFPIFFLFVQAFKSNNELVSNIFNFWPENFDLMKIVEVWQNSDLSIYFLNSLIVVVGAVICAVLFNGLLAYGVSIVKPKGVKLIYGLIMASYMIPSVLSIIPLFSMIVSMELINSFVVLRLVYGANVFYFINFKNYFDKIPNELVEAMKIDGCGDFKIFFKLILPVSKPIVGIVAIFAVTAAWGDYLLPSLVLKDENLLTIMVKLFNIQNTMGTDPSFTMDAFLMTLMLSMLPQIVIFLVFQKQITGGSMDGGVKG